MNLILNLGIRSWLFYRTGIGKRIRTIPAASVLRKPAPAMSFNPEKVFGGISQVENHFLCSLACLLKSENVFEIGTCTGATAYALSQCVSGRVYTLDLPETESHTLLKTEKTEQAFMGTQKKDLFWNGKAGEEKIVPLRGDSAKFDFTPYQNNIDLVFIDGSHSYEYVKNDTGKGISLLRPRGAIVWHDYMPAWPGVVRALNEWSDRIRLYHIRSTSMVLYLTPGLEREIFET